MPTKTTLTPAEIIAAAEEAIADARRQQATEDAAAAAAAAEEHHASARELVAAFAPVERILERLGEEAAAARDASLAALDLAAILKAEAHYLASREARTSWRSSYNSALDVLGAEVRHLPRKPDMRHVDSTLFGAASGAGAFWSEGSILGAIRAQVPSIAADMVEAAKAEAGVAHLDEEAI